MVQEPMVPVVDDYADAREMYAAWLRVSGSRVSLAGTVTDALPLALRHLPDAILMDLSLPGSDGLEATRRLKADPRTRHIPILAMTGHVEARVADDVRVIGSLIQRTGGRPPEGPV